MSTYVIGDVQGCFDELQQLLDKIEFNPAHDTLWFVGDLVNRGSGSLETLRFVKSLEDKAVTVLGNHDLHLLALACGVRPAGKDPTLEPILSAADFQSLIHWLLRRPLLHSEDSFVMVHAGLHKDWSMGTATSLAREIESELAKAAGAEERVDLDTLHSTMKALYGATDGTWSDNAATDNRLRYAVNCFTRMRFCDIQGTPDFKFSGPPGSQPSTLTPWFEMQNESQQQRTLCIGHWAAMGLKAVDNLHALDSGCVWGNSLTAMRLSDRRLYQIDCSSYS